jgi:polyhydroxyalkanoate synthesis regulator phasin
MNPDTLIQTVQKTYRVTIGAAATLLDSVQDSQLREENFAKLRSNPNQLIDDLAIKGETTEQEARKFVDGVFSQQSGQSSAAPRPTDSSTPSAATSSIQQDLQELTAQMAAIRAELERLRTKDS